MDEANDSKNPETGVVVLAAGASSRMRRGAKQLLRFENKTLLRLAAESATGSKAAKTVVVLGANSAEMHDEIKDLPVKVCFNENWAQGLSSSIKCGFKALLDETENLRAVVFTLADQPFITAEKINSLMEAFEKTGKRLVAAEYNETVGVPALFSAELFAELETIEGDKGAKQLILKHLDFAELVSLPEAAVDIDTPEDFERIKK
jgi:molybdenum cofactor cytidylyltransferase